MDMTDVKPTCRVVGPQARFIGKQALSYTPGISAETVGAQGIHLQLVTIPPGGRAKAHRHESHETAIHVLSGESGMWYGDRLERHLMISAGSFSTFPPVCRICPTIRARRRIASR